MDAQGLSSRLAQTGAVMHVESWPEYLTDSKRAPRDTWRTCYDIIGKRFRAVKTVTILCSEPVVGA
jgi:hypothetical protein